MAREIALAVADAGGRTFFVGGMVRDRICGRETKDIDIEIHGITPQKLREILETLGNVTSMGLSFGILGLQHYDIDIAMPRCEHATGRGHKDFEVYVDPFLGLEKAAKRRDFTMNALMEDVLTGEILDFFGGQEDMRRGVLRHVNDMTFQEDPLRVLRGAQFAARFGYEIADETVALAKSMDLTALPKERIFGEMVKAFEKAERPSIFFEQLWRMDQLHDWFPEVEALRGVPQDPIHHPEGDVWVHTMMVLDEAAKLRDKTKDPVAFMSAALVHDFGKVAATKAEPSVPGTLSPELSSPGTSVPGTENTPVRIHSYQHEIAGLIPAKAFIQRLSLEKDLLKYCLNMTLMHMRPLTCFQGRASQKSTAHMFDESICPDELVLLAKADWLGRKDPPGFEEAEQFLKDRLASYYEIMDRPYVRGRDLVEAGAEPGPEFGDALDYAHKMRLAGVGKEDALKQTLAYLRKK